VFASVCADFGAELVELDGEDDPVHLLVAYPPHVAVARLVNALWGVSARRLRQRYRVRTHGSACGRRRTSPRRPLALHWRCSSSTSASGAPRIGRASPAVNGGLAPGKLGQVGPHALGSAND
jgi:Transposase IS200 like